MFETSEYAATRKPLLQAETLPAHCYTSKTFFKKEVETIFTPGWHFVGRVDEIAENGSYLVVDTVVGSALVCRDSNSRIHGFLNACRHRGTRLKDGSGKCKNIVCPYHAWSYAPDGRLLSTPGFGHIENFDKGDYSLQELQLESWGGFLFVSFSQDVPPLIEWLGDFTDRFEAHRPDELRCVWRKAFKVAANWKFLMENALEAYHTGIVHGDTLGAQDSRPVSTSGQWDALYVFGEENKSIATLPGEVQAMPFIKGLEGEAFEGTWFTVIYPCTQIVFSQDCVWWQDIKPVTENSSMITLGGCFPQSTIQMEDFDLRMQPFIQRWSCATPEDNTIAEAQQRGHVSGLNLPGRFSAREHCVHALNNWVLDQVLED